MLMFYLELCDLIGREEYNISRIVLNVWLKKYPHKKYSISVEEPNQTKNNFLKTEGNQFG